MPTRAWVWHPPWRRSGGGGAVWGEKLAHALAVIAHSDRLFAGLGAAIQECLNDFSTVGQDGNFDEPPLDVLPETMVDIGKGIEVRHQRLHSRVAADVVEDVLDLGGI